MSDVNVHVSLNVASLN